jgi:hypothetical protein
MLPRALYPPDAFATDVGSGFAGEVNVIAVGSWQWSCTANCAGATCLLGPGAADSHSGARDRARATFWCAADPCPYAGNSACDVPRYCAAGDYIDCCTVGPVVSGTLPDAIGSLACRSKITGLCARPPTVALEPAAFVPRL